MTHRKKSRQIIRSFEAKALRKRSFTVKIADYLTSYFGSVGFLILNIIIFTVWIVINLGLIPSIPVFDEFPFVLLITAVSLEAIILTTIVLMSQNKQGHISTLRDELQLQVELITEREITKILRLLRELLKEKGYELKDEELEEMLSTVDTSYIERKLEEQLGTKQETLPEKVTKPILKVGKKVGDGLKGQNKDSE